MAVNMDKLKVFIGSLGNAAQAGVVLIGGKLELYRVLPEDASKLNRVGTNGEDLTRFVRKHSGPKTLRNDAKGWRKRYQPFVLSRRWIAAAVLLSLLYSPSQSYSECKSNYEERVAQELSVLGKRGDAIARARGQVLEILQQENSCAAWFQESDPDPAEVFRSLHFAVEQSGPSRVYGVRNYQGEEHFKHPWAARSFENGGRGSIIQVNANGPFFNRTSILMEAETGGTVSRPSGIAVLVISTYAGNTPEAQITILLHELGHIIGLLPQDDDSWDGRSSRNTSQVLRHCKTETTRPHIPVREAATRRPS